jgi:hypothetical protein
MVEAMGLKKFGNEVPSKAWPAYRVSLKSINWIKSYGESTDNRQIDGLVIWYASFHFLRIVG